MKKLSTSLALIISLGASLSSHAEPGEFYLVPGVQWMDFDEEVGLGNDWGFSAGLGFQFTERLAAELSTFDLDPDMPGGTEVDLDHYRVDLLYDVGQQLGSWQPFVVGGLGNTKFGGDNDSTMGLGAGMKLRLSDRVEWRTALRHFSYLGRDHEDGDWGIDSGIIIYLGSRDSGSARETASETNRSPARPGRPAQPSTPAQSEPRNEPSAPDADGDGVPDSGDACADTPRNYAVDERGCPIPVEEVARVELLVNFEFDRDEVRSQYFDEIEEVADFMDQYPDVVIELEGHTDSVGTDAYNQDLSERRANAVRQVMIDRFSVSPGRITARGFGEGQPIASNATDAGRAQNRRVITVIIKTLQNYQPR